MSEIVKTQDLVERSVEFWTGIKLPNSAAEELSGHFLAARNDFSTLRGKAAFEEEPASFVDALQYSKEKVQ